MVSVLQRFVKIIILMIVYNKKVGEQGYSISLWSVILATGYSPEVTEGAQNLLILESSTLKTLTQHLSQISSANRSWVYD